MCVFIEYTHFYLIIIHILKIIVNKLIIDLQISLTRL